MTPRFQPWSDETAREVLAHINEPGPVLIALQALQAEFGYVHADAVSIVALRFNVSRADVYGVLTYYRDLLTSTPPDTQVRICMGEACQSVGARALMADARAWASDDIGVDHVYCLGNCALGPAATVNDRLYGRVTPGSLAAVVDRGHAS